MYRRRFIAGSLTTGVVGLAGCLGGGGEGEEECLPEDPEDFFAMRGENIEFWAPSGNGFTLEVPRQPRRPDFEEREEREEHERTHWLDLTYLDEDDNPYGLTIEAWNSEEYANDAGSTAEPGVISIPGEPLIDAPAVMSGSRGRYSYSVMGESEDQRDEIRQLFLMIQCIDEEHIQDTTW